MSELHSPVTDLVSPPVSLGANIRLHPAGVPAALPQPVSRSFGRNFLDYQDPFEAAGRQMHKFTFSNSYDLRGQPPQPIVEEIRQRLHEELSEGNLANAELQLIDFNDAGAQNEPPRRFVVTSTNTRRNSLVTVNAYFQPYGQHLFYSVRSYMLPDLSTWKLVLAIGVGLVGLGLTKIVPLLGLVLLVHVCLYLRTFLRNLFAGDSLRLALRKQFPGRFDSGTFDDDDTTAFLKTNLTLTLRTIAEVLEKYGVDTGTLRTTIERLEINNVNTGGGSIIGAAIGGIAHRIAAEVRT